MLATAPDTTIAAIFDLSGWERTVGEHDPDRGLTGGCQGFSPPARVHRRIGATAVQNTQTIGGAAYLTGAVVSFISNKGGVGKTR